MFAQIYRRPKMQIMQMEEKTSQHISEPYPDTASSMKTTLPTLTLE